MHGLREVSIRLRLYLYCALAREVKRLRRRRLLLRPGQKTGAIWIVAGEFF